MTARPVVELDPAQVAEIIVRTAALCSELVLANQLEIQAEDRAKRAQSPGASLSDPHDGKAAEPSKRPLVDAQTLAGSLGCSRDCVYDHAEELGGQRIGNGPRGRLRFDLDRALAAWTSRSTSKESQEAESRAVRADFPRPRRRRKGRGADLLPIKGSPARLDAQQEGS